MAEAVGEASEQLARTRRDVEASSAVLEQSQARLAGGDEPVNLAGLAASDSSGLVLIAVGLGLLLMFGRKGS